MGLCVWYGVCVSVCARVCVCACVWWWGGVEWGEWGHKGGTGRMCMHRFLDVWLARGGLKIELEKEQLKLTTPAPPPLNPCTPSPSP